MKINLITIGTHMPSWIQEGFQEYIKRLPSHIHFQLTEIPQKKYTSKISVEKIQEEETKLIIEKIPKDSYVIALDKHGKNFHTETLANKLKSYQDNSRNLAILIGGPEGFSPEINKVANEIWSFSAMTFPHPLVRVILAEQLYRGFSILAGHPYHR